MKFTKQVLIAITIAALTTRPVFGAESPSPSKPVLKKARSLSAAESAADADVDGAADLLAALSSPSAKTKSGDRGVVADNQSTTTTTDSANIMTQMLHIPASQVKLRTKYRDNNHPLVRLCFKFYDIFQYLLNNLHEITQEVVLSHFKNYAAGFMNIYPHITNLGQALRGKRNGLMMCFATDECISFTKGTGEFDKMDPNEECVMYNIRHTFYSIMLDGGTDPEKFTTDVAAKVFEEHFDLWDFIPVCCMGTEKNPEGNKWSVVLKQLKDDASGFGLDKADVESFWWLLCHINSSFRPFMHYAKKTDKPYSMLVTSITAMQKGYGINTIGDPLRSPFVEIFFTCHPQAAMCSLPNRKVHPPESVKKYGEHAAEFFAGALTNKKFDNIDLKPPSVENKLLYYFRKAKIPPHTNATPEEIKAHEDTMFAMYTIPHLAAVAARETNDYDLSHLSLPHEFKDSEDRETYKELVKRLGEDKLLIKLRRRRQRQLEGMAKNKKMNLLHLAAVVVRRHGTDRLGRVTADMFQDASDRDTFIKWSNKFGGDNELSKKLVEAYARLRDQWESSSMKEMNELRYLSVVVPSAVVANQFSADQDGDISMSTFDFGLLYDEDDSTLATKHAAICGGNDNLLKKLVEIRKDFQKSAFAEQSMLRRLALVAAQKTDANTLTSSSSLVSLFEEEKDIANFNTLSERYDDDMLFTMFQPHLARYQGVCQGIPELVFGDFTLPHRSCDSPFTSTNPRFIIGAKTRGHGLSGFPVCRSCFDSCIIGNKYSAYELHILEGKEKSDSLLPKERGRLKAIRPLKFVSQLGSSFWNRDVVVIGQESLRGINLSQCHLNTSTPKVTRVNAEDKVLVGDSIISINGMSTKNVTFQEAQLILHECTSNAVLVIGRLMTTTNDNQQTCVYQMREKTETRTAGKAGIQVKVCEITGMVKVTKVDPNGALHECKVGDLVLSINGTDVSGIGGKGEEGLAELANLLRKEGGKEFEILTAVPMQM